MKIFKKVFMFFIAIVLAFSVLTGCDGTSEREKDIVILYTGDVHCAVDENIGYAGLSSYKKSLVAQGYEVILVDTGGAIQGGAIGSFTKGADIISLMNEVGYDALTLGNHEFDYGGPKQLTSLAEIADFPFLSLNLTADEGEVMPCEPYTIIEKDGVKIAFLGISTPETLTSSTPAYFMDEDGNLVYNFLEDNTGELLYSEVQKQVDKVISNGADYVIAMAHLGIDALSSPFTSKELIANTRGIDVVLDGHSHSVIGCDRVKNKDGDVTLLTSTGTRLVNIGALYIEKDGNVSTGLVSDVQGRDETITQFIDEIYGEYNEKLELVVGQLQNDLVVNDPESGLRIIRHKETNLGDFVADAYRYVGDADIAFSNGGGIRVGISAGDVTYGDLLDVHPFGNLLCKMEVTGQSIIDALEFSVSGVPNEMGRFLQVSGLTFEFDPTIPSPVKIDENDMFLRIEGERRVKIVLVGGVEIDVDKKYTVVSSNYILTNSGNGYTMFNDGRLIMDEFMLDADAITQYMEEGYLENADHYLNPYGDGRIVELGE